ncbi:hypothetical protein HanPSC8_Chr02g0046831 [Helianthus annuus]|nr:hypothetical protein HanPSC8_Chr02g0046831 [Helianthus annuus]
MKIIDGYVDKYACINLYFIVSNLGDKKRGFYLRSQLRFGKLTTINVVYNCQYPKVTKGSIRNRFMI